MITMAKTIEERAKAYMLEKNYGTEAEYAYIAGATKQRSIDIDKVCKWLHENKANYDYINLDGDVFDSSLIDDLKKALKADAE